MATRVGNETPPSYVRVPISNETAWRGLYGCFKSARLFVKEVCVKRVSKEAGVGSSG